MTTGSVFLILPSTPLHSNVVVGALSLILLSSPLAEVLEALNFVLAASVSPQSSPNPEEMPK